MSNDVRKRLPWMLVLLGLGHLAIIAALAMSTSTPPRPAMKPSMSILESFQGDVAK